MRAFIEFLDGAVGQIDFDGDEWEYIVYAMEYCNFLFSFFFLQMKRNFKGFMPKCLVDDYDEVDAEILKVDRHGN